MANRTFNKLPSNLSFSRGFTITDAPFYQLVDGDADPTTYRRHPVRIVRHGLRGTQNIAPGSGTVERAKTRQVANPQLTESAKLDDGATGFVVEFDLRALDLRSCLHSCTGTGADLEAMRASIADFVRRALDGDAHRKVAERYARNIANARFLWRNRLIAESIEVRVALPDGETVVVEDAFDVPLDRFDDPTDAERRIGEVIAAGMRGERGATLRVSACVRTGTSGALEVFPSQNYLGSEQRAQMSVSRSLYKLPGTRPERDTRETDGAVELGTAALRDQKVSNALRTIDTWYPGAGAPIPVEPNGASLEHDRFFRSGTSTAFDRLRKLDGLSETDDDMLYMVAVLMRGGVVNEKGPKASDGPAASDEAAA